ncbi:hypothetical protein RJ640_008786 [Escallonia rubra]|uniref:Uncharacterized protein n=1 Tax=Escallonia rubra TaxID=112253 RepID=A0AA88QWJ0_9ASTE|nr:hypothetical protein RJ640_008786 [Escallonia rubra]
MMQKQSTTAAAAAACVNCGAEERRLPLHHVRHRGVFRRLCTSCVLRLHPQSFCPTCFAVYDRPPPPSHDFATCLRCYSSSHSLCVGPSSSHHPDRYTCPLCLNPTAPIFSVKHGEDGGGSEGYKEIDKKGAKVLLAAAKIAAVSMNKAAVATRAEAEKRAKEAASTRKRAKELLEHVASLVAKDKLKRKELLSPEVSGSRNVVRSGNVVSRVVKVDRNRIGDRVDGSGDVLAALNAVELKEKERLQVGKGQNVVSGATSNVVAMDVEVNDRVTVGSVSNVGARNHGAQNENVTGRSGDSGRVDSHSEQGKKVGNGLHSILPVGRPQYVKSNNAMEGNVGSQQ